jgi:hypothetical protein
MAKNKVFVSFDYDHDNSLKGDLIAQSRRPDSPFSLVDSSLSQALPQQEWLGHAQREIAKCDIFVVILGKHTHQAQGVLKEVNVAKGLHKRRFQLKSQGTTPVQLKDAGPIVNWRWENLKSALS